jgi:hypothetical protein
VPGPVVVNNGGAGAWAAILVFVMLALIAVFLFTGGFLSSGGDVDVKADLPKLNAPAAPSAPVAPAAPAADGGG